LEAFLAAGEPPVYFGLGNMRAPHGLTTVMVQAARALGAGRSYPVVLSRREN